MFESLRGKTGYSHVNHAKILLKAFTNTFGNGILIIVVLSMNIVAAGSQELTME